MLYMINLLFCISICGLFLNYSYYLKSLMMIEFIVTSLLLFLIMGIFGDCDYIIFVLILSVCEGILGLLMVLLIYRIWGSDSFMLIDFNF